MNIQWTLQKNLQRFNPIKQINSSTWPVETAFWLRQQWGREGGGERRETDRVKRGREGWERQRDKKRRGSERERERSKSGFKHSLEERDLLWGVVGDEHSHHQAVDGYDTRHDDRDDGFHDELRAHHRHGGDARATLGRAVRRAQR